MDSNINFLTDEEIDEFLAELDTDKDGFVEYHEVERKLDEVSKELGWSRQLPVGIYTYSNHEYSTRTDRA